MEWPSGRQKETRRVSVCVLDLFSGLIATRGVFEGRLAGSNVPGYLAREGEM